MSKNKAVSHEWDYETVEDGEILDHNHRDNLSEFTESDITDTLVLVRDEEVFNTGDQFRYWAYVKDGKLPTYFEDSTALPIGIKVPQKYHKELAKYNKP